VTAAACGALAFGARRSVAAETGMQPGQGQPGTQTTRTSAGGTESAAELTHATATVASIDRSAHTVTLKKEDGEEVTVDVPSDVKAYDRLKVGDRVDIDYYESLAVSMAPPGTKPSMSTRKTRSMTGQGAGAAAKETTINAQVMSVDPSANKVTFKGPHGKMQTITVQDPTMQQKLQTLKPGQTVQFVYTQATAAAIRPAAGQ
jgi:Cu/Ag efflux protein CusF